MTAPRSTSELRRHFRSARRALDAGRQTANAEAVARVLVNAGVLQRADRCGVYFALHADGELDTLPLLGRLWSASKAVGCPVIGAAAGMAFYRTRPATRLVSNRFGIPEPATRGPRAGEYMNPRSLTVLFLPLVAFDADGTRLGMGGGYYDRYLGGIDRTLRPLLVGLAHDVQRSATPLPRQPWDVPLDAVATESDWHAFTPRAKVAQWR
jgi:5-formyltetrahydrofolate cyclo-ligase